MSKDKTTLVFEMKAIGAKFEGKLDDRGTEAVGHGSRAGVQWPLTLSTIWHGIGMIVFTNRWNSLVNSRRSCSRCRCL